MTVGTKFTRPEAVVQRLLEEDAFKQKRYNHPLGYIINMILTYFESKVNLFKTYPQDMHNAQWRITNKSERSEPLLPEIVAHGVGFCQKKWLLHYDRNGNLPYCEPRTIPTSMLRSCILAAQVQTCSIPLLDAKHS